MTRSPARPLSLARSAAALVVGLIVGFVGLMPAGAQVPADHSTDPNEVAAWWLSSELDRVATTARTGGPVDVGLVLDHALALLALGYERATVDATLVAIEPRVAGYVTPNGTPTSGALGKTLATALLTGRGGRYGGIDLEAELRANMTTEGPRTGEFPNYRGDHAGQGFTQAWAIMGLARTGAGVPAPAVDWLLQVQCEAGGFRAGYPSRLTTGCDGGGHVDATAISLQALLVVQPRTPAIATAVARGADWLATRAQRPDGSFTDGDKQPPNTNSTGLAAQALRATGRSAAADRARAWVVERQIGCAAEAAHRGAFTYSVPGELPGGDGPRAVPQAVMALGLPAYGSIGGGGRTEARPLHCPDPDKPGGPDKPDKPDEPEPPDTDPPPPPEPPPPPTPLPPGAPGGHGAGAPGSGGAGSGTGAGGDGPAGPATVGDPDEPGDVLALVGGRRLDADSDLEDRRSRDDEDTIGPLPAASGGRRPLGPTPDTSPSPFGPTAVAAGLGLAVVVATGVRTGRLTVARRRATTATAPTTTTPSATTPTGDGTGTRTEELPEGPYG